MRDKRYQYQLEGTEVLVEADSEGDCRYMVRMQIPGRMARVRIGYLTGAKHTWVAECFGGSRPTMRAGSAKAACQLLAKWACQQPSITHYFSHQES
ncbi:hypothetical protein HAQ00_00690 [Acidithiobacillus caldus ATCC 51756]|uniref:hypothetical protein n=1 Tax=Acidithiobacillus caldus TaxID=33059 RepID=UPI001C0746EF|nr:hypothetical protein [Acidithiobacillus caldus]MBU2734271.1 hypothetical protein [Acidithiobacillus caldus ATCC 51756]MBU2801747.1 hypothetical protein [Acidithiobacillus caldus]